MVCSTLPTKVSGCLGTEDGVAMLCRIRSYLPTLRATRDQTALSTRSHPLRVSRFCMTILNSHHLVTIFVLLNWIPCEATMSATIARDTTVLAGTQVHRGQTKAWVRKKSAVWCQKSCQRTGYLHAVRRYTVSTGGCRRGASRGVRACLKYTIFLARSVGKPLFSDAGRRHATSQGDR